jgi:diguanylate cyclase (GGDEF)-like protein
MQSEYENKLQDNAKLKKVNADLNKIAQDTVAFYEITQEICKSLDENKIFNIFKERINRYLEISDCRFLNVKADLAPYQDDTIIPLRIDKNDIGYLIARGVREEDKEKFHILSQQFLLGIKRALLYKEVQELAIMDGLTAVFSRKYFLDRLDEELKRSEKFKLNFSFLMADIDHFKRYNDHYGHLVGDAILREISKAIKENIRQIDFVGRYGGEEITIILAETGKEEARYAAERIRQAIESKPIKAYDENLKVTASIGIASFPDDAKDIQALIDRADEAMYKAKEAGRNRVYVYGNT